MLKDIIANFNQKRLTDEQQKILNIIKEHRHLIVRINRNDTFLEPFNPYVTTCLGCGLTNLYFAFHDPFSEAVQSIYLDAKERKNNFQYLTHVYYLDYINLKNEYDRLLNEGYTFEEIFDKLRNTYDLHDDVSLKKTKKL